MNLIEFRKKYPNANFIADEDVTEVLDDYNQQINYNGNTIFDIDVIIDFYMEMYSGSPNISEYVVTINQ